MAADAGGGLLSSICHIHVCACVCGWVCDYRVWPSCYWLAPSVALVDRICRSNGLIQLDGDSIQWPPLLCETQVNILLKWSFHSQVWYYLGGTTHNAIHQSINEQTREILEWSNIEHVTKKPVPSLSLSLSLSPILALAWIMDILSWATLKGPCVDKICRHGAGQLILKRGPSVGARGCAKVAIRRIIVAGHLLLRQFFNWFYPTPPPPSPSLRTRPPIWFVLQFAQPDEFDGYFFFWGSSCFFGFEFIGVLCWVEIWSLFFTKTRVFFFHEFFGHLSIHKSPISIVWFRAILLPIYSSMKYDFRQIQSKFSWVISLASNHTVGISS